MAALAPTITLIHLGFTVDGLESIRCIDKGQAGRTLQLCFRTAEKAKAFVQNCRSPNGDGFLCTGPDSQGFSWCLGTPTIKVNPEDPESPARVDDNSRIRTFSATYVNCRAAEMHPTQQKLVQYLKFVYNPERLRAAFFDKAGNPCSPIKGTWKKVSQ